MRASKFVFLVAVLCFSSKWSSRRNQNRSLSRSARPFSVRFVLIPMQVICLMLALCNSLSRSLFVSSIRNREIRMLVSTFSAILLSTNRKVLALGDLWPCGNTRSRSGFVASQRRHLENSPLRKTRARILVLYWCTSIISKQQPLLLSGDILEQLQKPRVKLDKIACT
jgi:hypothetical protein